MLVQRRPGESKILTFYPWKGCLLTYLTHKFRLTSDILTLVLDLKEIDQMLFSHGGNLRSHKLT